MKNKIFILLNLILAAVSFSSCEKDLMSYEARTASILMFAEMRLG